METPSSEPCMNTLRIKVLMRMWNSLPPDADCSTRKSISASLQELCLKHPEGGEELLSEVMSLCNDSKSCCDIEEAKIWEYLEEITGKKPVTPDIVSK